MYRCESWTIQKAESWRIDASVVLQKTLESPLGNKEIKPVNPKGNQPWIIIGKTDAEAEAPILWPHESKNWLLRKDPDTGKEWRQKEGDGIGWDGWRASPTQWIWVWVSSRRWWRAGKPGMLKSKELDLTEWLNNNNARGHFYSQEQFLFTFFTPSLFFWSQRWENQWTNSALCPSYWIYKFFF